MKKQIDNNRVIKNLTWRFLERAGAQGVTFIVSIVLARLLDPGVYGTIALVTVFTSILQVFIDSGLGTAVIQKKNPDDLDYSTIFWFNLASCLLLYILLFACAPLIALFYNRSELTPVIRVLGLTLVISGVKNVQQAYVSKNLLFKKFFFATLGGTIGAAVIGIIFANLGFGVWALVAQHVFNTLVDTIILWSTIKWKPKFIFSINRLKSLFAYGWKLLVATLIETVYYDVRQLIIGKLYSSEDLAFYNRGKQFPDFVVKNINTSIKSVLLPVMASEQDVNMRVKAMTRRSIKTSVYLIAPIMVGLAVCGDPIVKILLTDKWLSCVFFLRIFCMSYLFYPIHTANLSAIKALGRSDIYLKLEIIKKIVGIFCLIVTMWISVEAMAYSLLITSVISQIINSWPNKKLMGYSYREQLKDICPSLLLAFLMGAIVYPISLLGLNVYLSLVVQVFVGVVVYVAGSVILKNDSFVYLLKFIKRRKS